MDLSTTCHGALRLSRWLRERSRQPLQLRGVHVEDPSVARSEPRGVALPVGRAQPRMVAAATAVGAAEAFDGFEVVSGDAPEQELPRVAEEHGAIGLIVGRAGDSESWSLVSLGKVTRRLLRHAPLPTMVVPPDFDPAAAERGPGPAPGTSPGPIVVAVAPVEHARAPIRFAQRLAEALELRLLLVHVIPDPSLYGLAAADPAYVATTQALLDRDAITLRAQEDLERWLGAEGFAPLPIRVVLGRKGPSTLEVAESEQASFIVCGSRRLSLRERIFQSSLGTDLASHANRPVVVVPPPDDPLA